MRLVPCSPPVGIASDALVDAPVTSIASALLALDAAARGARSEPAWRAYWDLSEESGPYYLRAELRGDGSGAAGLAGERHADARASAWYRIDVQDELEARATGAASTSTAAAHVASMCLVGRWRRGEAAPVLYARETVRARVRAHGARLAGAVREARRSASNGTSNAAPSAGAGTTGDRLVGRNISDA